MACEPAERQGREQPVRVGDERREVEVKSCREFWNHLWAYRRTYAKTKLQIQFGGAVDGVAGGCVGADVDLASGRAAGFGLVRAG